jgi:hypothetical protein
MLEGLFHTYKSLKTTLKAKIDFEAWSTLNSGTPARLIAKPPAAHCGEGVWGLGIVKEFLL